MKADGLKFKQGMLLHLQCNRTDGVIEVMPCILLRSIDDQELVVQPKSKEEFSAFDIGNSCSTRITVDDKRYVFNTTILSNTGHNREIHLSYPQQTTDGFIRKAPRFQLAKPIRLALRSGDNVLTIYVHDISRSGACLVAEHSLAKGEDVLNIELRDPFNQSLVTLHCLVRYVMFDIVNGVITYRHGVEFLFHDDDEQLQLENFIEYLLHERFAFPTSIQ